MGRYDSDDPYWRREYARQDEEAAKRKLHLNLEIERSEIDSKRLDHEIDRLRDAETSSDPNAETDYQREITRLRNLSSQELSIQFRNDCSKLAHWIENNNHIFDVVRQRVPKVLRQLTIADANTGEIIAAHIESINTATNKSRGFDGTHNYRLALYDLWHGMSYLKSILDAWKRKQTK